MSAVFDAQLLAEVFVTLFVIMDPPGTVPVFLGLTGTMTAKGRNRAARQAILVAFGVIVTFALFGQQVLDYMNISLPALQASGGLLLLLVAMELLTVPLSDGWGVSARPVSSSMATRSSSRPPEACSAGSEMFM